MRPVKTAGLFPPVPLNAIVGFSEVDARDAAWPTGGLGGHVEIGATLEGDGLGIGIRDSGVGMTAEQVEIAMEPFGQIDTRLSRHTAGTGLGLPLARRLVELHGARLDLRSTPRQGTEVRIMLPPARLLPLGQPQAVS